VKRKKKTTRIKFDPELCVALGLADAAYHLALHRLASAHQKEYFRYYDEASAVFRSAQKGILHRLNQKRKKTR
jgi:hypothetical protein